jgi:hypothetical protein
MKVKIVSALLLLATVLSATAANARPYFAVNPVIGDLPVAPSCSAAPTVAYRYPPPYYYHHRRWHRHW